MPVFPYADLARLSYSPPREVASIPVSSTTLLTSRLPPTGMTTTILYLSENLNILAALVSQFVSIQDLSSLSSITTPQTPTAYQKRTHAVVLNLGVFETPSLPKASQLLYSSETCIQSNTFQSSSSSLLHPTTPALLQETMFKGVHGRILITYRMLPDMMDSPMARIKLKCTIAPRHMALVATKLDGNFSSESYFIEPDPKLDPRVMVAGSVG